MTWEIRYHDPKLRQAVLSLPAGLLARYFQCTDRMQVFGPDLGMPHTPTMGSGLLELRLKSREGIGRGFLLHDRRAANSHASPVCKKDGQDTAQRIGHGHQTFEGVETC